ncbi:G-patch domain-containing protein [Aphelenchoides besseyi]|nr:G-patch domain-containing protein [Aphelenchoides besseyi]KAI6193012.1 G-patch domain-containing protein [Aphelenchoides besseyi]
MKSPSSSTQLTAVDETTVQVEEVVAEMPAIAAMKLSFSVKKQVSKVVSTANHSTIVERTRDEAVTFMENGLVNGAVKKKEEVVIAPIQQTSDWRINRLEQSVADGTATDQQKALLELLLEASGRKAIDLKTDETVDQTLQSNANGEPDDVDPDYDQIKFSDFGNAFLRGFGWKKGEGIGRTNKRVVQLNVQAKGKTFDLGISKSKKRKTEKNGSDSTVESEIPMARGVAVRVIGGKFEGSYGRVVDIDAVAGRCDVKLANGTIQTIADGYLQTTSDKEYTDRGKVINKSSYNDYERRDQRKNQQDERKDCGDNRNGSDKSNRKAKDFDSDVEIIEIDEEKPSNSRASLWVAPELMVRVISKDYKEGRYYKSKMLVVDAADRDHCELRDDRGRLHTLKQKYLETVIPKIDGRVMIVRGKQRGQVGVVEDRDDRRYQLGVRVIGRHDLIMSDFDDVCEFHGNLDDMDY